MSAKTSCQDSCESARSLRAAGLTTLPDEVTELIIQYLPSRTLKLLSLVSKSFNRLVKPALFRHLDLGSRKASELERLCEELFIDQTGSLGPLAGLHLGKVAYRLMEETVDGTDVQQALFTLEKILSQVAGITLFTFEISLITEYVSSFEEHLVPALSRILSVASINSARYKVWIEAYGCGPAPPTMHDSVPSKLSRVLELFPSASIASLHLEGVSMLDLPASLCKTLASETLQELALKNCVNFPTNLPHIGGLRRLSLSWFSGDDFGMDGLAPGMQLLSLNNKTLRSLVLQNLAGQDVPNSARLSCPLVLHALLDLEIVDVSMGEGSVLDYLLTSTKMPNLRVLDLETEDIIDLRSNTDSMLAALPALERIELRESRMVRATQIDGGITEYDVLQASCGQRGIKLRSAYSTLSCNQPDDLIYEAKRMVTLSETLTEVHLTCQPSAMHAVAELEPVRALSLERLWLAIGNVMTSTDDADGKKDQALYDFCQWLQAPLCRKLQVTLFIDDETAVATFLDLQRVLENRLYPNLEQISGTLMALPGMSAESMENCERGIRDACRKSRIDDRDLKFVGRKSLIPKLADPPVIEATLAEGCHEQRGLEDSIDDASELVDGEEWIRRQLDDLSLGDQGEILGDQVPPK